MLRTGLENASKRNISARTVRVSTLPGISPKTHQYRSQLYDINHSKIRKQRAPRSAKGNGLDLGAVKRGARDGRESSNIIRAATHGIQMLTETGLSSEPIHLVGAVARNYCNWSASIHRYSLGGFTNCRRLRCFTSCDSRSVSDLGVTSTGGGRGVQGV